MMDWFITESDLQRLRDLSGRLYTQERMGADEMRDWAAKLMGIVGNCEQMPNEEEE